MTSAADDDFETQDVPAMGSMVVLLPRDASGERRGSVRAWESGALGLAVTARVAVNPADARDLAGSRVWVTARTAATGTLVVFESTAQRWSDRADELAISGVVPLAREPRRAAVRGPVAGAVRIQPGGDGPALEARSVDISRDGVRVVLPLSARLSPDQPVEIEVELGEGSSVTAEGRVLRSQTRGGEAVVRFVRMEPGDSEQVDRAVLSVLSSSLVPDRRG